MKQRTKILMSLMLTLSLTAGGASAVFAEDPYAQAADPYAQAADPYAQAADPYAQAADPYAQAADPYAQAADPYAQAADPYAQAADPYAQAADPYAQAADPYAQAASRTHRQQTRTHRQQTRTHRQQTRTHRQQTRTHRQQTPYAQAGDAAADPYAQAADAAEGEAPAEEAPAEGEKKSAADFEPSEDAKYTITETADGWIKVENEDGETLGVSANSGVGLIEEDGYAFKDMNQNGKLDAYEDWRLTNEERTEDLAGQMKGSEMAAVLTHGGWGDFTTEPLAEDDTSYTYLMSGGRGGVTRNISEGGTNHAKWANSIQEVAESSFYGIPAMISIDPANISGMIETLSLASTMNPELAAEIGQETAKQYRAAGVTALLGPQVDIASPVMERAGGTYGEDPQLTLDIATAYVNAMQSTYDENGEDLGWGDESVYCFTQHFGGAGSTEGGRDDHTNGGRYAVFPGNNLEAHLITYFDGVFNLPGKTGSSGVMTQYAINVDGEGNPVWRRMGRNL